MSAGRLFPALAIRDTNPHNSTALRASAKGVVLFGAANGLNQSVSLQYEGSFDGTTWFTIGSAIVVTAGAKNAQTITDPWPHIRVKATCSVAPASGTLELKYSSRDA